MIEHGEWLEMFFSEGRRRLMAEENAAEVLAWANKELMRMSASPTGSGIIDIPESVNVYEGIMSDRQEFFDLPPSAQKRLLFPWKSWNDKIDPLPGGMLMTLAGADGAGKTTYGECIAEWYARQGFKVVYYHFELSHTVMLDRRAARWSGLSIRQLKSELGAYEREQVSKSNAFIRSWGGNIQYVHCPGSTMESLTRSMKNLAIDGKCEVAVVDYLEKAQASPVQLKAYGQNVFQREADNVEQLKSTAERLEIPVVMISQLNKVGKSVSADELDRTHIRGAGEKTEKANVVVLIRRDRDAATGDYSPVVDVRIDKNTLGATGSFRQLMTPEFFRVSDADFERVELPRGGGR